MNVQNLENEEEDELQVNDMGIVIIPSFTQMIVVTG